MENKIKEIILNCEKMERRFALLGGGKLEEYKLERDNDDPEPGDIFLGKIVNLDQSLQAAFVDIGAAKNAFLHFRDMIPGNSGLIEQFKMEKLERQNTSVAKKKKNKLLKLIKRICQVHGVMRLIIISEELLRNIFIFTEELLVWNFSALW